MKKFYMFLAAAVILANAFVQIAFGAGSSMTFVRVDVTAPDGRQWSEFTATCTADDTDGTFPDTRIPGNLAGFKLFSVSIYYGATAPTADSDLTITEGSAAGADILGGAGVDAVDAVTNSFVKPVVGSTAVDVPIYRALYMQIDNNSVNDAVVTITLKFIQ
jgi:hypothetical protein